MDEYIGREALINVIATSTEPFTTGLVFRTISNQPAADVAPVRRGHWKRDKENRPICSECAEEPYRNGDYNLPNYCPNCGAKMEVPNDT